jgi:tetratricopeptide (TPR) repeat protein
LIIKCFGKGEKMKNSKSQYQEGIYNLHKGNLSKARETLTRAMRLAETEKCTEIAVRSCLEIAACALQLKQTDEAKEFYSRSLELLEGMEETHHRLFAETCVCLNSIHRRPGDDPRLGIEILEAAAKKIQTFEEPKQANVRFVFGMLGVLKDAIGHHFEAEPLLRRTLDLSLKSSPLDEYSNDQYFLDKLAEMLLGQSRQADAINAIQFYSLN